MSHLKQYWSPAVILILCLSPFGFTQEPSHHARPASMQADEAALRALVEQYFAVYAQKDVEGFVRLWHAKSPELEAKKKAAQETFADHEKIEVKDVSVSKVSLDGDKASLRLV